MNSAPDAPQVGEPAGHRHRQDVDEQVAVDDPARLAQLDPASRVGSARSARIDGSATAVTMSSSPARKTPAPKTASRMSVVPRVIARSVEWRRSAIRARPHGSGRLGWTESASRPTDLARGGRRRSGSGGRARDGAARSDTDEGGRLDRGDVHRIRSPGVETDGGRSRRGSGKPCEADEPARPRPAPSDGSARYRAGRTRSSGVARRGRALILSTALRAFGLAEPEPDDPAGPWRTSASSRRWQRRRRDGQAGQPRPRAIRLSAMASEPPMRSG